MGLTDPMKDDNIINITYVYSMYFGYSSLALLSGFFIIKDITKVKETKRIAWILSLITSCVCVFLCLKHVFELCFLHNFNIVAYDIYRDDQLTLFIVIFFVSSMVFELILGQIYYKETIDPLSGYFHHIFYIFLLGYSILQHFTLSFVIFLPLEIPTIVLSIGTVYPHLRNDIWFGITFLITRVIYHLVLLCNILRADFITHESRIILWPYCGLAFMLHIYWMSLWFKSYIERSNRIAVTEALEKVSSDFYNEIIEVEEVIIIKKSSKEEKIKDFMRKENLIEKYGQTKRKKKES